MGIFNLFGVFIFVLEYRSFKICVILYSGRREGEGKGVYRCMGKSVYRCMCGGVFVEIRRGY